MPIIGRARWSLVAAIAAVRRVNVPDRIGVPGRVDRMFTSTRKLGRPHQEVLIFVKGDPRKAASTCGGSQVL